VKLESETRTENTRARLELLYHISRELAAQLELSTVLQRVLFLSLQTLKGMSGSIIVLNDQEEPVDSAIIYGGQFFDQTTRQLQDTLDQGLAGWVVKNRQAVLVGDTSKEPRWLPRKYDDTQRNGPKSSVCSPLLARERLVGVMTLTHPSPNFFSSEHLDLIQAIADLAGIAVMNARYFDETQRSARVMTALVESASSISASLNLDEVLERILDQIIQALQVEAVSLALIDKEINDLEFRAAVGKKSTEIIGERIKMGEGIAGWVAQQGESLIVPDTAKDPRFNPQVDERTGYHTHAIACAPITSPSGVIGVLEAVNPKAGNFDKDALLVLNGIGSIAGTAIGHAQLFEQVEAAHRRYLDLFEDSIDPIFLTNEHGLIIEANLQAGAITGLDMQSLLGKNIQVFSPLDWDEFNKRIVDAPAGETHSYESTLQDIQENEVPVEIHVRQVHFEGVNRLQWIFRDITERKDLDKMRDDLIAMIYHDLRAPLANVVSGLDMLETVVPVDDDPSIKTVLDIAIRSTERVQRLSHSLLDITRLEAGQVLGSLKAVPASMLVLEAMDAVHHLAMGKHQRLATAVPDDLPPMKVDEDMIGRVLINLFENAIKYSPAEGEISAGAEVKDDLITLWIDDSGKGIPAEERERIFDKFSRLESKSTSAARGMGLGLAFCKIAVEAHGGKIWVEDRPDEGSRFIFSLPLS
jgi:PAS domain S-box-containing protein